MSPTVQAISFRTILSCVVVFASSGALAQTAIDNVHVTPLEKSKDVATAAYPAVGNYRGGSVLRTNVNLVLVPVTITDNLRRPVAGLDQDNFQVFEGKKAQEIKNFSSEDTPVSVGILVDTSGSMSYKLDRAREAVLQFCEAANPQDEFFMITFADVPQLTTDFTTSAERVESDLLTARSKGRTSLLDAIYMGIQKMRGARYTRKALLILSDGGDNHSRYSEHDVKSAVKEADVTIYAVGTYERYVATEEELLGPELLRSVAGLTGGQAFTITNANEMAAVTRDIGSQLRHQYVLAYQPQLAPHDGKWHKISVKLRLPKKLNYLLHIDARPGYYAGGE
ncbi:MAG: VWA domain-containing protein [Candidatus Sulfotelmatobacter sp.]